MDFHSDGVFDKIWHDSVVLGSNGRIASLLHNSDERRPGSFARSCPCLPRWYLMQDRGRPVSQIHDAKARCLAESHHPRFVPSSF